jgi:hypothetical protein
MRVEDMAAVMADHAEAMAATAADMPRQPMRGADTLLFAADVATIMRRMRAVMRAMPGAEVTGATAVAGLMGVAGEVITGEVITDIPTMDIPGTAWAIMDWATAIRITGMAITDIVPGGGTILTDTDTRPT